MSQAASQAAAFYSDVARTRRSWTLQDDQGYPAPMTPSGRAMPFWSSLARVRRIIATVPAYAGFEPEELTWEAFRDEWLPDLERDGMRIGVNWSGTRASGNDLPQASVRAAVEAEVAAAIDGDPTETAAP